MRYEDSKVKGMSKETLRSLEQIAMSASYTLEMRAALKAVTVMTRISLKSASTPSKRCLKKPICSAEPMPP